MIRFLILLMLWISASIISEASFMKHYKDSTLMQLYQGLSDNKKIIYHIIFAIGGPIFIANEALNIILETVFPEGWPNKNDNKNFEIKH